MRRQTHDYLNNLPPSVLVEIIQSLCRHSAIDVHHGPDPGDGKPIVYGTHYLHGTFTLANVDRAGKIDMDPRRTYTVKVEATNPERLHDLLGESVGNEISAYEIVGQPDNGCGCYGDPPCMGCAPVSDRTKKFEAARNALADLYTIDELAEIVDTIDLAHMMSKQQSTAFAFGHLFDCALVLKRKQQLIT